MTSPSRRKHQITALNTRKKARPTDRTDRWLTARWLAVGLTLILAISVCGREVPADEVNAPAQFYVDDDQAVPISEAASDHLRTTNQRQPSRPFSARWSDVSQRQIVRQPENWRLRWRESDALQRHNTNATASAVTTAQYITTQQALSVGHQLVPARSDSNVQRIRFNEPIRLDQDRTPSSEDPIHLVSQEVPADPFSDPFGDLDLPMPAERASDPPVLDPTLPSPATPERARFASQAAPPEPSQPQTPFGFDPPPAPPESPVAPCDRIYNRRDCCRVGQECDKHSRRVLESPLTEISLNITPQMTVTQLDRTNYEFELQNTMRRAQPRKWRNDDGETLAEGRMTDFKHGRVEIQTEDGLKKVPFADLSDDDMCFVTAWWSIPSECSLGNDPVIDRNWVASTLTWKASSLCHKPLYIEDVNLERYGHSAGPLVQPVLSGAHFFMNVAALPYNMGINPPTECRYPLGYYRPGDCAPWLVRPVPLSIRGGLTAAATYVGGTFVIP